jgi:hypothetical protein
VVHPWLETFVWQDHQPNDPDWFCLQIGTQVGNDDCDEVLVLNTSYTPSGRLPQNCRSLRLWSEVYDLFGTPHIGYLDY